MNYKEKYTPGLSKSDTEGLSKYTEPAFSLEEYRLETCPLRGIITTIPH